LADETKFGIMEVLGIGLVMLILSLIGVAADFVFDLKLDMDGLLLISVCLMMALVSAAMLFSLAKDQGWIGRQKSVPASAPATSAAPAASSKPAPQK
jgi:hypothetical protein